MDRDSIMNLTKGSIINTDVNAYAEVNQSALFYASREDAEIPSDFLVKHYSSKLGSILKDDFNRDEVYYGTALSMLSANKFDKFQSLVTAYENDDTSDPVKKDYYLGYLLLEKLKFLPG